MKKRLSNKAIRNLGIVGGVLITSAMIFGTLFAGITARSDAEKSAKEVSVLYLEELASRREEVVDSNINGRIFDLNTALNLMTDDDLQDLPHLQAYQAKMKQIYKLEKFAFVDNDGLIYTSLGTQDNISDYSFDYKTITKPEISIFNLKEEDKKVVIAIKTDKVLGGKNLVSCFMEIDMDEMLSGVSMGQGESKYTFSNIYTNDGVALSNTVLGGLAGEDNLLDALKIAIYDEQYSYEKIENDFKNGKKGIASFAYKGTKEIFSYVPINNTNWFLTYLIRDSIITDKVNVVSTNIMIRSIITTSITAVLLIVMFIYMIYEFNKNSKIQLETEKLIAINKAKQEDNVLLTNALDAAKEANKAKTIFLSNMSHEIRTPMNAIIGLDNIALNDPNISDSTRDYLVKIGSSAEHLLSLINDILDMSRIESGRLILKNEEFSFSKLIEHINAMFSGQCEEKGLRYHCEINGEIGEYYIGDNIKLRQVLINILGNAVKFTPQGGEVNLLIEKKRTFEDKEVVEFVIKDNGEGISDEFLPHIFDSFAQENPGAANKYGSSGLGLAITKNIVELMNGNIEVESKKNVGTKFILTVTLTKVERDVKTKYEAILPKNLTALIIDDDEVALEHGKLVLEKAGVSVVTSKSAKDGIEKVNNQHARMEPFNLILVDWKMPEMDGVEVTKEIRKIAGNESAIIMLTAYKWDDIINEAIEAGIDSFISKPLFAKTVLEEFEEALARKGVIKKLDYISLNGKRILLAEDVEINAEIMMKLLEMENMSVEWAENGKIALDKFAASKEGYFDAILMDMRMPEMDGLEATRAIRALDRKDAQLIPIIALTANALDEDVEKSLQAGLNAHLSKPIQPEVLYQTLKELIKK